MSDLSEQMKAFNPSAAMSVSASLPALPGLSLFIEPTTDGSLAPLSDQKSQKSHKGSTSELQALRFGLDSDTAGRRKIGAQHANSVPEILTSIRGTQITVEDCGPMLKL